MTAAQEFFRKRMPFLRFNLRDLKAGGLKKGSPFFVGNHAPLSFQGWVGKPGGFWNERAAERGDGRRGGKDTKSRERVSSEEDFRTKPQPPPNLWKRKRVTTKVGRGFICIGTL